MNRPEWLSPISRPFVRGAGPFRARGDGLGIAQGKAAAPGTLDENPSRAHARIGLADTPLMLPRPTIEAFDRHLDALGLRFEGVVIGGSALALLGITQRATRDFDVLSPELSASITSAASGFAKAQRAAGIDLEDDC